MYVYLTCVLYGCVVCRRTIVAPRNVIALTACWDYDTGSDVYTLRTLWTVHSKRHGTHGNSVRQEGHTQKSPACVPDWTNRKSTLICACREHEIAMQVFYNSDFYLLWKGSEQSWSNRLNLCCAIVVLPTQSFFTISPHPCWKSIKYWLQKKRIKAVQRKSVTGFTHNTSLLVWVYNQVYFVYWFLSRDVLSLIKQKV